MRILTVVGARPQFVKAAPVSRALRRNHEEVLVHTGQHYDDAMSASFFRELEIPEPDINLEVGSGSHAVMTGEMLRRLEPVVLEHRPDGVLLYGDTNSTMAAAIVASKACYDGGLRPWIAHVEAGLRSFNLAMPEERNRVVADHLADLLLAPTETAMRHLQREGLGDRAELVGDVMVDAFAWASERATGKLPEVAEEHPGYLLLTLHRPENVDDPSRLAAWLAAVLAESFRLAARGERTADVAGVPIVLATMHASWGAGFLAGCLRFGPPTGAIRRHVRRAAGRSRGGRLPNSATARRILGF